MGTILSEWEGQYNALWREYTIKKDKLNQECWKFIKGYLKKHGFRWNEELQAYERLSERGIVRIKWGVNYIEVLSTDPKEAHEFADILNNGTLTITSAGMGGQIYFECGRVECTDVMRALWETLDLFGEEGG